MASVSLNNIIKSFEKNIKVLDNINIDIEDGEFLVLVGPSGCGKSTLLRMVAGLEEPTEGDISIDNSIITHLLPKDRNIAMVFQNYALYPHMNVYNNLAFALKQKRFSKTAIKDRVKKAAEILDIQDLLARRPKELSGGQRQRVALGRAIVRDPQVFLFDEPLSNLDAKLRVQMRAEIKRLHKQLKSTIIYVTHDQVEAMTMGDRLVILHGGVIQQVGTPLEVYNNPVNMFVAGFIGSPPINFIKGNYDKGRFINDYFNIDISMLPGIDKYQGKPITIGIRPGTIQLSDSGVSLPLIVTEPLGNETILHLRAGETSIVAKVRGVDPRSLEEEIKIKFIPEHIYAFDSETQLRIQ